VVSVAAGQLWVADFVYRRGARVVHVAVILDAWPLRVMGYALGRQTDTRLPLAALRAQSTRIILLRD
jgi:hypothetical protein